MENASLFFAAVPDAFFFFFHIVVYSDGSGVAKPFNSNLCQ